MVNEHIKWSKKYTSCVKCGKNDSPHRSKGLCKRCYCQKVRAAYAKNRKKYKNVDIIGERFGRLVVLCKTPDKTYHYTCRCDCGNQIKVNKHSLLNGLTQSCKCLHREAIRLKKGEASFNKLYIQYKKDALRRGLSFFISKNDFRQLTSSSCYYCGKPPGTVTEQVRTDERGRRYGLFGNYVYNGIDRMNCSQGYEQNNCVSCCNRCNFLKQTMSAEQFKNWVVKVYKHFIENAK